MAKIKPKVRGIRRLFGMGVLAWNIWRRLPSKQRRQALGLVRKHGPRVAKTAFKLKRKTRRISR